MPSSRFWGYYDFIVAYNKTPEQAMEEAKTEKLKEADWADEVKELKRKLAHDKQKALHCDTLKK